MSSRKRLMTNIQYGILIFLASLVCITISILLKTISDTGTIFPTNTTFPASFTSPVPIQLSVTNTDLFALAPLSLTLTPQPSFTPTPTPALTKGPFIIYLSGRILKILSTDGSGARSVNLPENLLPGPISPDGKWIVLIGKDTSFSGYSLYLLNIFQQNIISIPIIPSEEYYYYAFESALDDWVPWSTDSKYLVIIGVERPDAGAVMVMTKRIFIYSVDLDRIITVSVDLPILEGYSWSPDGRHLAIIHLEETMAEFPLKEISIVHMESVVDTLFASVILKKECYSPNGWLSSNEYLYSTGGCQISPFYGPISIDIHTNSSMPIWPDHSDDWEIDPVRKIIYVHGGKWEEDIGESEHWKYYISNFGGTNKIDISANIMDEPDYFVIRYRGGAKYPFMYLRYGAEDYYERIFGITQNGNLEILNNRINIMVSISPIRKMMAIYNSEGMDIYNNEDVIQRQFEINNIQRLYWMDQQGRLFIIAENTLYMWIFSEDSPKPIYIIPENENCCNQLRWLE
jgi:hypothetical protein